jgi:FkbM family methyltransferase
VLDIGANIGNHSLVFSRFREHVVAFEPGLRNFSLLQRNSDPARKTGAAARGHSAAFLAPERHAGYQVSQFCAH